jgi:hypothetical protein
MEAIEYKGYTIDIEQSDYVEDPTNDCTPEDREATFVLKHRNYTLPCEVDVDLDAYNSWEEVAQAVTGNKPYKFVRWYEHSGIAVSLRDNASVNDWDAGIVGIIFGDTTDRIESVFNEWKQYVEGDVYDYVIKDSDGDVVDSLCCIYGYDFTVEEAKYFIDDYLKTRHTKVNNAVIVHG